MSIKIAAIEHLTLTVSDIATTVAFYQKVLGMNMLIQGEGEVSLTFGRQQFKLRTPGDDFFGVAQETQTNADITLLLASPIEKAVAHLQSLEVKIIEGPRRSNTRQGVFSSLKFYDPDQNIIEIGCYH